jgi:hypothetical protein
MMQALMPGHGGLDRFLRPQTHMEIDMTKIDQKGFAGSRQLTTDEIDAVTGGATQGIRGGTTRDGVWVTCGDIKFVNGRIYIGGINGPVAIGW